jgi:hypothetical protein
MSAGSSRWLGGRSASCKSFAHRSAGFSPCRRPDAGAAARGDVGVVVDSLSADALTGAAGDARGGQAGNSQLPDAAGARQATFPASAQTARPRARDRRAPRARGQGGSMRGWR